MITMKKLSVILSLFGVMAVFGFGFSMQNTPASSVEQIHLSCWDEQGASSFERIRLVLNTSLTGLIWFSSFQGDTLDQGTITPQISQDAASPVPSASTFALHILSASEDFIAQIPNFVFQPHIRSIRVMVEKNQVTSSLECKKINLQKRVSFQSNDKTASASL
jgi:hypothetical protein